MSLCVFTADADSLLLASAAKAGIAIKYYNINQWPGYVTGKLREGVKFLSGQTEEFAMWVDGHDSLILKSESEIIARLQSMGFPLLISAERTCWPDAHRASEFKSVSGMPQFPNAGGFIGLRSEVLTAMHQAIQCATDEDDQRAWTTGILSGIIQVQIDHARRIFCSEGDGGAAVADPCVRHWNGATPGRGEFWGKINA